MNKSELDDLLVFAEQNHLMDARFQDVFMQYDKDLRETFEESFEQTIDPMYDINY